MSENLDQRNRGIIKKLVLTVAGMFAFAFAMVPLYNVLCEVTGLNGKTKIGRAHV